MNGNFLNELSRAGPKGIENPEQRRELPLQIQGLVVVAWIIFVEGVEIIATWAAANAQYGASAASVGVLVSFSLVGALAGALFATGIFRDLRRDLLRGLAAVTITSSGAYCENGARRDREIGEADRLSATFDRAAQTAVKAANVIGRNWRASTPTSNWRFKGFNRPWL